MSETTWVGGSSNSWGDVLNWSGGSLPTSSAVFTGSSATVTINTPFSGDILKRSLGGLTLNGDLSNLTGNLSVEEGFVELNKSGAVTLSNLNINFAPLSSQVSSYISSIVQTYGNTTLSGKVSANLAIKEASFVSLTGDLNLTNKLSFSNTSRVFRLGKFGTSFNDSVRYNLLGELEGSAAIAKYTSGTLVYNPSNTTNFSGYVSLNGGNLKIVNTNLGSKAPSSSFVQFYSAATVEVRQGSANITSGGGLAGVYIGTTSAPIRIFASSPEKDYSINGLVNFGNLTTMSTTSILNFTTHSRDGYGISFSNIFPSTSGAFSLDTQTSGPLIINGSLGSNPAGILVSRNNEGKVIVNGTNSIKTLTLNGNNTFILKGTSIIPSSIASTFTVNANKLYIDNFLSLAANTTITISTGTSGGALILNGSGVSSAGLQKTEAIRMNGSSGYIYANQPVGAVLLSGGIAQYYTSTPSTTLRGSNKEDNTISGITNIGSVTNHSLRKEGIGTWVLDAFSNITGITSELGTLKIKGSNVLPPTVSIYMGSGISNYAPEDTNVTNTLEFVSTPTSNNSFYVGILSSPVTDANVKLSPNSGNTVNISADASTSVSGTLNILGADSINTFTSRGSSGYQGPYRYFNGADVVFSASGVYRAPVYGSDVGFSTPDTLNTNTHAMVSPGVSLSTSAGLNLSSLKITGSNATLTLEQDSTLLSNLIIASGGTSYVNGINAKFSNSTVIIRANDLSDKLVFNSDLEATSTLIKSGLGTLELAGSNNSIGALTINSGKVKLTGSSYLKPDSISVGTIVLRSGTVLDLGSNNSNTSYISALSGTGNIVNSTSLDKTIFISSSSTAFQGAIHDTGGGKLSVAVNNINFNRLNTYSGDTTLYGYATINSLTDLGQPSSVGKGNLIFTGGGITYTGAIYEGQSFPILGYQSSKTNRIPVLGEDAYTITIRSNAQEYNSIMWTNPGEIVHTFVSDKTILFRGSSVGKNTFNCKITDSGEAPNITSVRKEDFGVWALSGNNTYSGSTIIVSGILSADPGTSLPLNSQLDIVSGTLHGNGVLSKEIGWDSGKMTLGTTLYGHAGFSAGSQGLEVFWPDTPVWGSTSGFLSARSCLILNGGHTNDVYNGFFTPPIAEGCVNIKGNISLGSANTVSKNVTTTISGAISTQVGSTTPLKYQISLTGGVTTADLSVGQLISNATSNTIITNIFSDTVIETTGLVSGNVTITGLPCRPIRVDENVYSGEDYAVISGNISGDAGLLKLGSGRLELLGNNTYNGPTHIEFGTIAVTSLGSSGSNNSSSLGQTLNADSDASAVYMGVSNAVSYSSSSPTIAYKGPGEISNRKILLYGHGTFSIDADGAGPLVLTNLINSQNATSNSSKTLLLRGSNLERNRVTSNLADSSNNINGKLIVQITSSNWTLEGNNTYTGTTSLYTGAYLGLGSDSCVGPGNLSVTSGLATLEAVNGSRTLNNMLFTSSTTYFVGSNSLRFSQPMQVSNTAISTITNNMSGNANLAFEGMHSLYESNSSIIFNGSGTTRIDGDITRSTETYKWSVTKADSGNLVFAGNTTAISGITVSAGNLIFESSNATTYGNITATSGNISFKGSKVNVKGNCTFSGASIHLGA